MESALTGGLTGRLKGLFLAEAMDGGHHGQAIALSSSLLSIILFFSPLSGLLTADSQSWSFRGIHSLSTPLFLLVSRRPATSMSQPVIYRTPPLAGRPPFATNEPDSAYDQRQPDQTRRLRQPAPANPNDRTSAYNM